MNIVAHARNAKQRPGFLGRVPGMLLGAVFALIPRSRNAAAASLVAFAGVLLIGYPAHADLIIELITWDAVGLDHNRPLVSGPQYFPVGAKVCNTSGTAVSGVEVSMAWEVGFDATYIYSRPGSLTTLEFDEIPANGMR